jgi:5-methylcytosine-specific restriction endonuclease McrA
MSDVLDHVVRHGTLTGYTTDRCRCDECSDTYRAYQREWKAARLVDPDAPHDRVRYLCGCRCVACRAANAAYNMGRKARLRDSQAVPHGTLDGYGSYGCRCGECSAAKRAATRDHYIRNQIRFLETASNRAQLKNRDRRLITARDIRRLLARHSGRCFYCYGREHLELDHVVPLSRGGRHSIGNLVPACRRCNRRKSARFLAEWKRSWTL